jgi:4-hydroxy-tetrahydrodipicolinate synthase
MSFEELRRRLAGVVAIPVTPFDERGDLDEPAHTKVLRRMLDGGIEVVTPNGNTGEFYALTEPETRRVVDLTMAAAGDDTTVLAGVGHSTGDAVAAATYAGRAGAHAIMIHQPVHPYASADGWIEYHRRIADAVPDLGVVLYLRSTRITGHDVARLGELSPNVVAVKYAVPDPVRFATVARDADRDRFVWLAGLAELSAPGYWVTGATGFTSGLANVDPTSPLRLLAALRAADHAETMRLWEHIRPFEALRAAGEAENNVSVVKEALAQLGICRADVRPPSSTLDETGRSSVAAVLADWGLTGGAGA